MKLNIENNILDRAIEQVAPRIGLKRKHARMKLAIAGSYTGASKKRKSMASWATSGGDADSDLLYDRQALIERSRDLVRNSPIAAGAVNTVCSNTIGPGLKLHPQIDAEYLKMSDEKADEWERNTAREFLLWADSPRCDIEDTQNFFEKQELVLRQTLENGDVFVLTPRKSVSGFPYSLRLQIVEADRICNEKKIRNGKLENGSVLFEGIEKDKSGCPIRYHICNKHPGNWRFSGDQEWKKIDAFGEKTGLRNVLHIYKMLRPGQSRGIPYLTPVIEALQQLKTYTEAELMAAVISGMLTVFIKTESGDVDMAPMIGAGNSSDNKDTEGYQLGNGAIIGLAPDEDVSTVNPGRPNTAFDPFINSIIKQIGVGLDLPGEVLIKSFLSSYSASRAALLEAWRVYKTRRTWIASKFCNPVYEIWMYEAVLSERLYAPYFLTDPLARKAYLGATWVGPTQGQIDPVKEVNAAEKRINIGISTVQRETVEYSGEEFERNKSQIKRERDFFDKLNKELEQ